MAGMRESSIALVAGTASAFTATAGIVAGFMEPTEAAWLGAGWVLALMILAGASKGVQDPLYPARVQLARFRRSEEPADLLLVRFPRGRWPGRASAKRAARAALAALRVSDGATVLRSPHGLGLCAVLPPDVRARTTVENRLRKVCGDELVLGWARFPEEGVSLESLIDAAADRIQDDLPLPRPSRVPEALPGRQLASRSLTPEDLPARRIR
jgi:hypothetical protein